MKRHLLIDGDVLVYRFAHGEQQATAWDVDGVELYTYHAWFEPARERLASFVHDLLEELSASSYTVALSDLTDNFRNDVMPSYKTGRRGVVRPLLFGPLRDYLNAEHQAVVWRRLEGDDVLGILGTKPTKRDVVTVSIDKDLLTVPGQHFNIDKPDQGVVTIQPAEAERNFLTQVLCGDATDGYPGCPGIGPVKAARLLDKAATWETVVGAYQKAKLGEAVALINARCARILRHGDYNLETGEVTLWTPPRGE